MTAENTERSDDDVRLSNLGSQCKETQELMLHSVSDSGKTTFKRLLSKPRIAAHSARLVILALMIKINAPLGRNWRIAMKRDQSSLTQYRQRRNAPGGQGTQTDIWDPWIIHRKHHKDRETGKQEFYHKNITTAVTTEPLEAEEYLLEILSTDKPY